MADQDMMKQMAAAAAIEFISHDAIIGVGTGSTVKFFIEELAKIKSKIEGTVASSIATEQLLKSHDIPVFSLNAAGQVDLYVDGADEFNAHKQLIKGGGGALTREKIIAAVSKKFVCIADTSKQVNVLGQGPLPIEVIPMARSYVAREVVKLGGSPEYREDFVTDNGNIILDVYNLKLEQASQIEAVLNNITGVITNGLFCRRTADTVLIGTNSQLETIE